MNVQTHIINAAGQFDGLKDLISNTVDETLLKIEKVMPVENVDLLISDMPYHIIPNYGLGGIAATPYIAELYIDPEFKNIEKTNKRKISSHNLP